MDVNVGGLKTASFPSFSRTYFKENHSQSAPIALDESFTHREGIHSF
jgi:hypothetical protein